MSGDFMICRLDGKEPTCREGISQGMEGALIRDIQVLI